jgi:hypothetical protein
MATMICCPSCGNPYDDDKPDRWACDPCVWSGCYLRHAIRLSPPLPAPPRSKPPSPRREWWRS